MSTFLTSLNPELHERIAHGPHGEILQYTSVRFARTVKAQVHPNLPMACPAPRHDSSHLLSKKQQWNGLLSGLAF